MIFHTLCYSRKGPTDDLKHSRKQDLNAVDPSSLLRVDVTTGSYGNSKNTHTHMISNTHWPLDPIHLRKLQMYIYLTQSSKSTKY